MGTPTSVMVKVDRQGRLVLPAPWRDELTSTPGEVAMTHTEEGVLITAVPTQGTITIADDGLPVLRIGRTVKNEEVTAAIDTARAAR